MPSGTSRTPMTVQTTPRMLLTVLTKSICQVC
jgi:hypothetical protein